MEEKKADTVKGRLYKGSSYLNVYSASRKGKPNESSVDVYLHSARWKVAYMGLLYGFMMYLFRIDMNMALPSMVGPTFGDVTTESTSTLVNMTNVTSMGDDNVHKDAKMSEDCPEIVKAEKDKLQSAEFTWDKRTQSFVLSAYYYGLLAFQIPFGWVAERFGGKRVIFVAMATSSGLTLLVPVLARASVYAVIAVRVALGLCSSATLPAWYRLMSRWALPHERSRFTGICWFGQYLGTIVGFFTSGFLCAKGFDNGWGSVFYIHGILGALFIAIWTYVVVELPENHPNINKNELQLLTAISSTMQSRQKDVKIPWLKILTHVPALAVFVTHFLDCVVHYLVLICLPLYMKWVLKFDIESNGAYTSLPFISCATSLFLSGVLADHVIKRKLLSATATRKVVQVTALLGTAVCICLPGFMTCHQRAWVIFVLCIGMFFQAAGHSAGYLASPVDMAPRYSSVIYAVSNSFGTLAGILTPYAVAELTTHDTVAEWRVVFLIATGCAAGAAVVFGLFSSSELAPWAVGQDYSAEGHDSGVKTAMKPLFSDVKDNTNVLVDRHAVKIDAV